MKKALLRGLLLLLTLALLMTMAACGGDDATSDTSNGSETSGNSEKEDVSHMQIIETKYETVDTVVSGFNVLDYGADPTGQQDSTTAIKTALSACSLDGGGTVWMPAGKYLVTDTIRISSMITLRGDYQDPDKGTEYGTIILADVESKDDTEAGLFILNDCSGVEGLTVYYPGQDIQNVKPYPYTFYCPHGSYRTVKNCTVINGYRGIGTAHHNMMHVKNFKGTFLNTAVLLTDGADVGTVDGLTVSAKYWANAGSGLKAADEKAITNYCQKNETAGLTLGDVEQYQFNDISVSDVTYGVYLPLINTRWMGCGSIYHLTTKNCRYGFYTPTGKTTKGHTNIDYRLGYNIAGGSISGSEYSIYNGSEVLEGKTAATVKLCGVKLSGATHGRILKTSAGVDLSAVRIDTNRAVKTTGSKLVVVTAKSDETAIQKALDEVGNAGGGVVYLKAGEYSIKKGLSVPANTELHGVAGLGHNKAVSATILSVEQDKCKDASAARKATAALTLAGENAGVSGVYFLYRDNITSINADGTYENLPYAVRGTAKGVYCCDCCISGATYGLDFTGCDDHVVEYLVTGCILNCIRVGGNNGSVMNCLQNGTMIYRNGVVNANEAKAFENFFDSLARLKQQYIIVEQGKGEKLTNCFAYGVCDALVTKQAENLQVINIGGDNIGDAGTGAMYRLTGGSATIINTLRIYGDSLKNDGCKVKIYNRMALGDAGEADYSGN